MIKSNIYELSQGMSPNGRVSTIQNERDRVKYKRKVSWHEQINLKVQDHTLGIACDGR